MATRCDSLHPHTTRTDGTSNTHTQQTLFQSRRENAKVSGVIPRFSWVRLIPPFPDSHSRLGIGPDGAPLPQPNKKRLHPRMYPVLVVNQDGSTYTIRHRSIPNLPRFHSPVPNIPRFHSPVPQVPTPDLGSASGPGDPLTGGEGGEREGKEGGQGESVRRGRHGG